MKLAEAQAQEWRALAGAAGGAAPAGARAPGRFAALLAAQADEAPASGGEPPSAPHAAERQASGGQPDAVDGERAPRAGGPQATGAQHGPVDGERASDAQAGGQRAPAVQPGVGGPLPGALPDRAEAASGPDPDGAENETAGALPPPAAAALLALKGVVGPLPDGAAASGPASVASSRSGIPAAAGLEPASSPPWVRASSARPAGSLPVASGSLLDGPLPPEATSAAPSGPGLPAEQLPATDGQPAENPLPGEGNGPVPLAAEAAADPALPPLPAGVASHGAPGTPSGGPATGAAPSFAARPGLLPAGERDLSGAVSAPAGEADPPKGRGHSASEAGPDGSAGSDAAATAADDISAAEAQPTARTPDPAARDGLASALPADAAPLPAGSLPPADEAPRGGPSASASPDEGAPSRTVRRAGPPAEAGPATGASPVPGAARAAAGASPVPGAARAAADASPVTAAREGAARAHPAAAGAVPADAASAAPPSPAPAAQGTETAAAPSASTGRATDGSQAPAAGDATVGQDGAETAPAGEPAGADLARSDPLAPSPAPLTALPADLRLERPAEPRAGGAGADGPLALAAPEAPAELQDRILEAAAGEGEIEIVLAPETLGRLRIRVEMRDGSAQVSFTTETAEAARLLSGQEGRLSDLLEKHGLSLGRHEAGQGDTGRRAEAPLPQIRPRALRPAPDPSETVARAAAGTVNLIA